MQLTEELTHVALACQAKYDRMGEELGFNVLFYRLGYAWVLYEADEVERMRSIVEMHHRIGVGSRFLSPDETLRHLPILRGGEPVAGAVLNDDAIVHHDAVVWAHLEHLARTTASGSCRTRRSARSSGRAGRRRGRRHGPRPDRDAGRPERRRRLVDRAERAGRRRRRPTARSVARSSSPRRSAARSRPPSRSTARPKAGSTRRSAARS